MMGDYEMMMNEHEDVMDRVWMSDAANDDDYNPDGYMEYDDEQDNELECD
jgi:hypothetical protein